jgi:hypothetical protein
MARTRCQYEYLVTQRWDGTPDNKVWCELGPGISGNVSKRDNLKELLIDEMLGKVLRLFDCSFHKGGQVAVGKLNKCSVRAKGMTYSSDQHL